MRPRAELLAGMVLLTVLGIGAAALGSRRARVGEGDPRRSTYLAGPSGARGYADALGRLGVEVVRHRRSVEWLDSLAGEPATVVIVLEPSTPLSAGEARQLAALDADLLLAGVATDPVTTCLGYRVQGRQESAPVARDGTAERFPLVRAELVRHLARTVTDSSRRQDGEDVTCEIPEPVAVDTLLRTEAGRPVALALRYPGGRRVTMVADSRLFRNRALRETAAGPFALGLVVPRYRRALVEELHHGYEISGSLAGATLDWSLRTPWG
ncbi:MAG TPA: DUF4350 domain-containing protein, partial [Gemmatimonadales bacterium]|nr:DUF4350 domain-containing protein [Gemmatimonadales bacterium]